RRRTKRTKIRTGQVEMLNVYVTWLNSATGPTTGPIPSALPSCCSGGPPASKRMWTSNARCLEAARRARQQLPRSNRGVRALVLRRKHMGWAGTTWPTWMGPGAGPAVSKVARQLRRRGM
ncbi:unnamed protein product, partial [Pylaiella littoralis]